jgi:hypothetical protein
MAISKHTGTSVISSINQILEGAETAGFLLLRRLAEMRWMKTMFRNRNIKNYFDGAAEPFKDMRQVYAPLVWQRRYGGIEVPENLCNMPTVELRKNIARTKVGFSE